MPTVTLANFNVTALCHDPETRMSVGFPDLP